MSEAPAPRPGAFSLPDDLHYLNCAYMSPLPKVVEEAVVAGLRRKRDPTELGPSDFFETAESVRKRFARIVGGADDRVAILPSASYGVSICARNIPVERGERIVLTDEQFPGNVYAWRRVARDRGGEVVTVGPGDAADADGSPGASGGRSRGARWNERLLDAVDDRTAVVTLPHVHWTDGTRFDLESVCARARDVGAAVVIDATQSVGALPLDVGELRPDAVIVATYKWLLGPYGMALAWLGPRLDGGVPLEETWMGREGSEDFQRLVDYTDAYQPGARRYDVGEVANFALLPGVEAGLGLVLELGPERIQRYCADLTHPLVGSVRERGFAVEDEAWRAHHLFGIRMRPGVDLGGLKEELDRRRIVASLRGTALRVSPHVYNDEADVAALGEVLAGV